MHHYLDFLNRDLVPAYIAHIGTHLQCVGAGREVGAYPLPLGAWGTPVIVAAAEQARLVVDGAGIARNDSRILDAERVRLAAAQLNSRHVVEHIGEGRILGSRRLHHIVDYKILQVHFELPLLCCHLRRVERDESADCTHIEASVGGKDSRRIIELVGGQAVVNAISRHLSARAVDLVKTARRTYPEVAFVVAVDAADGALSKHLVELEAMYLHSQRLNEEEPIGVGTNPNFP